MSRKTKYFLSISLLAVGAFVGVAFVSVSGRDWPFAASAVWQEVSNLSGPLGSWIAYLSFGALGGLFAWILPLGTVALGVGLAINRAVPVVRWLVKSAAIVVLLNAFIAILPFGQSDLLTGSIGRKIASLLTAVIGEIGGTILLITCLLLLLLREFRHVGQAGADAVEAARRVRTPRFAFLSSLANGIRYSGALVKDRVGAFALGRDDVEEAIEVVEPKRPARRKAEEPEERERIVVPDDVPWADATRDPEPPPLPRRDPAPPPAADAGEEDVPIISHGPAAVEKSGIPLEEAELPDLEILATAGQTFEPFYTEEQLLQWSAVLEDKLANYGIEGKVTDVNQGPVVTTFEFEPSPGVKIKDIVSRADDLALAMRARSLRLIAPIPGRAVVGIEIPNPDQRSVFLRDVLEEIPDRQRISGLMIALGVDANGKPFTFNLCSAPHLLMAGTTGSGKSVSLNCFLASLLFQYRPSDLRMILVDPKMVEMSVYNDIPHLLHPVITDPREAVHAFNFLIAEMERRNELFRKNGVKNLESFNSKLAMGRVDPDYGDEKLPYIVLVVDELGDLVLKKGADIESLLSRLGNMARAAGIHMILATQRPSVDVIVGKTKANFPTRIAFRVAQKVDSRTILDTMGAEKLLGKGDMLYVDAKHPEALRLHGAWFSEDELEQLVAHWKQYEYEDRRLSFFEETQAQGAAGDRDPLFDEARLVVLNANQGSTSLLQRRLNVGYARAARILDQLELAGIVGPPNGSKPREIFVSDEEIERALDE